MKSIHIIQRLFLFLFALVLAAPAWSKTDTWSAKNRNKNETETTRQSDDGIVTITWTNCKASRALMSKSRNFEFIKKRAGALGLRKWMARAWHQFFG